MMVLLNKLRYLVKLMTKREVGGGLGQMFECINGPYVFWLFLVQKYLYFQTVFKNSSVTLNLFIYFFAPWPLFDRSSNSSKCHNFISRCDPRESRKETYHWSFELLLENSINQKPKRSGRGSEFPDWRFFFMIYPN